jgi:hypothetical protein
LLAPGIISLSLVSSRNISMGWMVHTNTHTHAHTCTFRPRFQGHGHRVSQPSSNATARKKASMARTLLPTFHHSPLHNFYYFLGRVRCASIDLWDMIQDQLMARSRARTMMLGYARVLGRPPTPPKCSLPDRSIVNNKVRLSVTGR